MAVPSPRWFGRVSEDGTRVELFQRRLYQRWLKSKAGKLVTVIVEIAVKRRSTQANAYWHAVVVERFREHCGYLTSEHDAVHDELVRLLLGPRPGSNPSFPIRRSTTTLSTKEFSDLIEAAQILAAEKFGLVIEDPDPNWFLRRTRNGTTPDASRATSDHQRNTQE